jgi:hypothetical protein
MKAYSIEIAIDGKAIQSSTSSGLHQGSPLPRATVVFLRNDAKNARL